MELRSAPNNFAKYFLCKKINTEAGCSKLNMYIFLRQEFQQVSF